MLIMLNGLGSNTPPCIQTSNSLETLAMLDSYIQLQQILSPLIQIRIYQGVEFECQQNIKLLSQCWCYHYFSVDIYSILLLFLKKSTIFFFIIFKKNLTLNLLGSKRMKISFLVTMVSSTFLIQIKRESHENLDFGKFFGIHKNRWPSIPLRINQIKIEI